jgi:single-strand DNA-binding protein
MAGSVNKVILVGNVGRDPEVRTLQNGGRVASFSVATSESWKDRTTGERREKTEWHRIAVYNEGLIGIIERFVKKGSKLYLEGALETRKWTDQSGQEKSTTEIVLKQFRGELTLLDGRGEGGGGDRSPPDGYGAAPGGAAPGGGAPEGGGYGGSGYGGGSGSGAGGASGGGYGGGASGGGSGGGRSSTPAPRPRDDIDDDIPF